MMLKWNNIKNKDILKAIDFFEKNQPDYIKPHGIYVIVGNKKYPAKTIRKVAYNLKNDSNISEDKFKGGSYTVNFFNKLGFDMEYNGDKFSADKTIKDKFVKNNSNKISDIKSCENKGLTTNNTNKIKISIKNVLEQKNALQLILNQIFDGDLVNEKSFEWMRTPENPKNAYPTLYNAIRNYRGDDEFARSNHKLSCDFVSESNKIIIEYDERQHFTEARRFSLLGYIDIPVYYDREKWIKACKDIQAIDNTPPNRDEKRAYYDSIRDIEAYKHGYKLIRIMHEEFDFEREDAYRYVKKLIESYTSTEFENNENQDNEKIINNNTTKKLNKSPSNQKNALQLVLNKIFDNDLVCEKAYDWMRTPKNPQKYPQLYNSLKKHDKNNKLTKNNYRLHCDFVSESNKIIIEYDEREHFSDRVLEK